MRGREKIRFALKIMPKLARDNVRQAIREVGEDATGLVKRLAPVLAHPSGTARPGALRDSVTGSPGDEAGEAYASVRKRATKNGTADPALAYVITAGNEQVDYAKHVEFGVKAHTAGGEFKGATIPAIPKQPFFWPGIRAAKNRGQPKINRAARKALKEWNKADGR